jgi:hypothetical protein
MSAFKLPASDAAGWMTGQNLRVNGGSASRSAIHHSMTLGCGLAFIRAKLYQSECVYVICR